MESMGCPWVSDDWRARLEEDGWRAAFYYVIVQGPDREAPTLEVVRHLRSEFGIEHDLHYDPDGHVESTCLDTYEHGWPTHIVVNTDDMLVWCATGGWWDDVALQVHFLRSVCEEGAANDPGYRP